MSTESIPTTTSRSCIYAHYCERSPELPKKDEKCSPPSLYPENFLLIRLTMRFRLTTATPPIFIVCLPCYRVSKH